MGHLVVIGANKVDGVAAIHTWVNNDHILSAGLEFICPYSICSHFLNYIQYIFRTHCCFEYC